MHQLTIGEDLRLLHRPKVPRVALLGVMDQIQIPITWGVTLLRATN